MNTSADKFYFIAYCFLSKQKQITEKNNIMGTNLVFQDPHTSLLSLSQRDKETYNSTLLLVIKQGTRPDISFCLLFLVYSQMASNAELITKKKELQKFLPGCFPVILVEKFQNWGMTQGMNVLSVRPKSVQEVEQVIDAMNRYNATKEGKPPLSIRCVGDGHSWSPLFPDDGNVLMYTSELVLEGGGRIRLNEVCFSPCGCSIMLG